MENKEKEKIKKTSDILLKGGKLLGESCPKCGGLLMQYQEKTFCVNCNYISKIEKKTTISNTDITLQIENLVSKKIEDISKILEKEEDIEKQTRLAELLLKYFEILRKVLKTKKKSKPKKDEKKND